MTDQTMTQPKAALGVGSIISESFSILFGNFIKVVLLGFVPYLIGFVISGFLVGFGVALGIDEPDFSGAGSAVTNVVSMLINMTVYSVITALLVQLAYDAKLSRPVRIGRYFGPALSAVVPLVVLSIVVSILAGIGIVLLIVPGLWIYAVFSVMAPAIVIERAGFGGLGRSRSLTKEYRWPILGALLLALVCFIIINLAALFLVTIVAAAGSVGMLVAVLLFTAMSTVGAGFLSILVALIYARLREIKEGISVDQIASVFD